MTRLPELRKSVKATSADGTALDSNEAIRRWLLDHDAPTAFIAERFGVVLAERSVGDVLRRLGFRRPVTRPQHPGRDASAQAPFSATSPPL